MKKFIFILLFILAFPLMGNANVWISDVPQLGYNSTNSVFFQEDFISGSTSSGQLGKMGWQLVGGTTTLSGGITNHPGVVRRDTSAVASTLTTINHLVGIATVWNDNDYQIEWIFRLNNTDTDTAVRIGSMSSFLSNPPVEGVYLEKLYTDTNWFFVSRTGGVQTRTDIGMSVAVEWLKVKIVKTSVGVDLFINNNYILTHTTNLTNYGQAAIQIINQTAASKTIDVDYCSIKISITR